MSSSRRNRSEPVHTRTDSPSPEPRPAALFRHQPAFGGRSTPPGALPARLLRAVAAFLLTVVVGSCSGDAPTGTRMPPYARLAIVPHAPSGAVISLEQVGSVNIVVRRLDGSLVADQRVPVEDRTVELSVQLEFTPPCEEFEVELFLIDRDDEVIFRAGPDTVEVCGDEVATHEASLRYVGVGSDAAAVVIVPAAQTLVVGAPFEFEARALDSVGEVIEGTPVRWRLLDAEVASLPDEASGALEAVAVGSARVEATLLTGQADTATLTVIERPVLVVAPEALAFSAAVGRGNPAPRTIQISNGGGGVLGWTASADAPWLSVTPEAGNTAEGASQLTAAVNVAGLTPGTHTAEITIASEGVDGSPRVVRVTLTLLEAAPILVRTPDRLEFSAVAGGPDPAAQTIQISNGGGGTLSWNVSADEPWLTVTPASGATADTDEVTVEVDVAELEPGTYTTTLQIVAENAEGSPQSVEVVLTVEPRTPVLEVSAEALAFSAVRGGPDPAAQTIQISNRGGGTLEWRIDGEASWVTVTPASGATADSDEVTVAVDLAELEPGTLTTTLQVVAEGAEGSPQAVEITLTLAEPVPVLVRSPEALTFSAVEGGARPASQTVDISNGGGGTLAWSVRSNQTWVVVEPASGTATEETDEVTVSVNTQGLSAGTHEAALTIAGEGADDSPQTVPITVNVAPRPTLQVAPQALTFTQYTDRPAPEAQTVQLSNGGGGSFAWAATADQPWVQIAPAEGTVSQGTQTLSVAVDVANLELGSHTAVITIAAEGAAGSPQTIAVSVEHSLPPPRLVRSPASFHFEGVAGGEGVVELLDISNGSGTGELNWSVSSNVEWIFLEPMEGNATEETDQVWVSIDYTLLAAGNHSAVITIEAPGAEDAPQTVDVTVSVSAAAPDLYDVRADWLPESSCGNSFMYQFTMSYFDLDRDVIPGEALVRGSVLYDDDRTQQIVLGPDGLIIEGDPMQGTMVGRACLDLGNSLSTQVTLVLYDAAGNPSQEYILFIEREPPA